MPSRSLGIECNFSRNSPVKVRRNNSTSTKPWTKLNVKYGDKTVCHRVGNRRFNLFNGLEN